MIDDLCELFETPFTPLPTVNLFSDFVEKFNCKRYYDSPIIQLLCRMTKNEIAFFEDSFPYQIAETFPSLMENGRDKQFKQFCSKRPLWVDDFLKSKHNNFADYYEELLQESLLIASQHYEKDKSFLQEVLINDNEDLYINESSYISRNQIFDILYFILGKSTSFLMTDIDSDIFKIVSDIVSDANNIMKYIEDGNCKDFEFGKSSDFIILTPSLMNAIGKNYDEAQGIYTINDIIKNIINYIWSMTFKSIREEMSNIEFINSIRADSKRFYAFDSNNTEFQHFLMDFIQTHEQFNEAEREFINRWLQKFEIADSYEIEMDKGAGSKIFLIRGEEKINLVDLGYGVTQFLPILLKIAYCDYLQGQMYDAERYADRRIVVLEEPETNLHPKYQSLLADMFCDASQTLKLQFIIETHSEYLIRKLQILTAKKDIKPEDSVIYYLGNPDPSKRTKGEDQVRKITIKPNGVLSQPFGTGFYDEADNLALDLMDYSLN